MNKYKMKNKIVSKGIRTQPNNGSNLNSPRNFLNLPIKFFSDLICHLQYLNEQTIALNL